MKDHGPEGMYQSLLVKSFLQYCCCQHSRMHLFLRGSQKVYPVCCGVSPLKVREERYTTYDD